MPDARFDRSPALFYIISAVLALFVALSPLTSPISDSSAFSALVMGGCIALFAFVYVTTRSPLCFLIPIATYFTALIGGADPISAVTSIAFFPPAFILSYLFIKPQKKPSPPSALQLKLTAALSRVTTPIKKAFTFERPASDKPTATPIAPSDATSDAPSDVPSDAPHRPQRIGAVAMMSASLIISGVLYVAITSFAAYGSVSLDALSGFIEAQNERMRAIMSSLYASGSTQYTDAAIDYMISYILVCLPSILICAANIVSYIATCIFSALARLTGTYSRLLGSEWSSSVSIVSAVFYALSYILAAASSASQSNALGALSTNLIIMLTPPFALMGLKGMWRRMRAPTPTYSFRPGRGISGLGVTYMILCLAMLFINPFVPVILLAALGTVDTIIAHITPLLTRRGGT